MGNKDSIEKKTVKAKVIKKKLLKAAQSWSAVVFRFI